MYVLQLNLIITLSIIIRCVKIELFCVFKVHDNLLLLLLILLVPLCDWTLMLGLFKEEKLYIRSRLYM